MRLSLPSAALADYVGAQLHAFFPEEAGLNDLATVMADALERVEACFSRIGAKGFRDAAGAVFNHRHTDQYAIFLYYLANSAFRRFGDHPLAEKAYALNKALHALDAFYEVELPDVFLLVHPVGTVLGRATYGNYFCSYQNVTVGGNLDDAHPVFGEGVVLYGGSRIIGAVEIGENSLVSAGAIVMDRQLPPGSVVFGQHPNIGHRPNIRSVIGDIFRPPDAAPDG